MSTGASSDGLFRGIYDGCISGHDMDISNRPYHRNCGCALHKMRRNCTHALPKSKVSYPIRRAGSENSLAMMVSGQSSPATPPANGEIGRTNSSSSLLSFYEDSVDPYNKPGN